MTNTIPLLITVVHLLFGWGLGLFINWISEGNVDVSVVSMGYFLIVIHKYTLKYYNLSYLLFNDPEKALEMAKKVQESFGDKNGKEK